MTLPVFTLDQIRAVAARPLVFDAVRDALIAHAESRTVVPAPIQLVFPYTDGDCHVKAGHIHGAAHFTVKVSTGSTATRHSACLPTTGS